MEPYVQDKCQNNFKKNTGNNRGILPFLRPLYIAYITKDRMKTERIYLLIARKMAGEASEAELHELEQLLDREPVLRYSFDMLNELDDLRPAGTMVEEEGKEALLKARQKRDAVLDYEAEAVAERKRFRLPVSLSIAATLLILLGAALYFYFPQHTASRPLKNEITTKVASKSTIVLPDGSKVSLNSCSRLNYADGFINGNRSVTLYGEGFFEVKHDPQHPFIIHAGNVNVRVLGTVLNVKAYPEDNTMETTLIKGKVEVDFNDAAAQKVILKPNQKITIYKSQLPSLKKAAIRPDPSTDFAVATVKKDTLQSIPEIAWVSDNLEFSNETLEELSHDLERRYNVTFHFQNQKYQQEVFSGAFGKQDIREVMYALELTSDFHYQMDSLRNIYIW